MRKIIYILLLIVSISMTPVHATSVNQSIKLDSKKLFLEGTKALSSIKNTEKKSYYSKILKEQKKVITEFIQYSNYNFLTKTNKERKEQNSLYYTDYLKNHYKSTLAEISNSEFSTEIDSNVKNEIEAVGISYQSEFAGDFLKDIQKYITSDILQTGNISFSYVGSGGFLRITATDYAITNSVIKNSRESNMKISVDTDMILPGRQVCDFDKNDEFVCTLGSPNHFVMNGAIEFNLKKIEDTYFIQMKDISLSPTSLTGAEAEKLHNAIDELKKYTLGKTYSYSLPNFGMSDKDNLIMLSEGIKLLTEKSIFTPYAKIGDEYIMIINPEFITRFRKIIQEDGLSKKNDFLFPELRYKNGVFYISYADNDKNIFNFSVGKDSKNVITFMTNIKEIGSYNSFTGILQNKAWNLNLSIPGEFNLSSSWDGYNTDTVISGSGIEMIGALFMGNSSNTGSNESVNKIQISGTLSRESTNLNLLINNIPSGLLQFVKSGSSTNFMSWLSFGKNRFDISGKAAEKFGSFDITTPLDISVLTGTGQENFSHTIEKITDILF